VSGTKSLEIAQKITKRAKFNPRYAYLTDIFTADGSIIDESIVIYFQAPHSYTGEDIVEFQCHGGVMISSIIIDEVCSLGARVATAGEFSKRAILNDKIDISQAEAISKLIEAKSQVAVRLLAKQLKGSLKEYVDKIRQDLIEILAFIEVNIDYAEEDLPKDLEDQIKQKLLKMSQFLKKSLDASIARDGLIEGFKVSIIGKPNVGKSTLLNSLLNYDRAIISDQAGTTRDTIEESIKIKTYLIKIVDTAGIRDSSDNIEKIGIQRSLKSADESNIIIAVFDASCRLDQEDSYIVDLINRYKNSKDIITIVNKSDLAIKDFNRDVIDSLNPIDTNFHTDIQSVLDKLTIILDQKSLDDDLILTSKRQINSVKEAHKLIEESISNLDEDELELFSYNINDAIQSISNITRPYNTDEMLDEMFSHFCLGK
jgi:tRNA modification GTPase